ncbi:hypothetical protein, partial [Bacillus infantis]|uniref:hypothetical protein n=1 Tax=Bacillus infantis TaxID=324767 RepID=UPI002964B28E
LLKKSINNAYLSMQIFRLASKLWHISLHFQVSLMDMGSVPLALFEIEPGGLSPWLTNRYN